MLRLRFETGPRTGEYFPIDKNRVGFGRSNTSDCVLNHPTVSREHFYVERNAGKYFVVDQESNNGTVVNGARVSWVELKRGDLIQAGPFALRVEFEEPATQEVASAPDLAPHQSEQSVSAPTLSTTQLTMYPREYLLGIEHFNAGRYFEAHEVWEEIWVRSSGETRLFYQMLIQAAVGLHHYERGNARGGRGMYAAVTEKLSKLPALFMSVDAAEFGRQFKGFFAELIELGNESPPAPDKVRPVIQLLGDAAASDML